MPKYLNVPFAEKDDAKRLGARWDPNAKLWYVPENISVQSFERWLPEQTETGTLIDAPIYLRESIENCYRCGRATRVYCLGVSSIVEQPEDNAFATDAETIENDGELIYLVDVAQLDDRLAAVLKRLAPTYSQTYSKTQEARVWMNHCEHCQSKLGDFFLHSEPGGAFFPVTMEESNIKDLLLYDSGRFTFSGGYSFQ
jgi:hypothetical protein